MMVKENNLTKIDIEEQELMADRLGRLIKCFLPLCGY